jgi:drug/metabolite transporter (DMT)-like permease
MIAGTPSHPHRRAGISLGVVCMLLWSSTAAMIALGGQNMKRWPWQFICLTGLIAGIGQLIFYAARGKLRGCLVMPWRLWAITILCFVVYGLVYPLSLMMSEGSRQVEVSLINCAWPVLTVVFAVLWVPGTRMTRRLAMAAALATAGLALANWDPLWGLLSPGGPHRNPWPYVMAGMAAVLWAAYSSLLSRWRVEAGRHATSPIGFILIGLVAGAMCLARHEWSWSPGGEAWAVVLGLSLGPFGAGYLLWELALHRAPASVLGLMGASLPATSTLLLGAVNHSGFKPHLLAAAGIVSAAVVLGNWRGPRATTEVVAVDRRP